MEIVWSIIAGAALFLGKTCFDLIKDPEVSKPTAVGMSIVAFSVMFYVFGQIVS